MITTASYKPFKKSTIDYSKSIVANKASSNYDPTKTTGLRNAFVRQIDIRFNTLKSRISKAIINQDCFGLISSTGNINLNSTSRADAPDSLPGNRAFAFSRNPEKMDSFMTWLDSQEKSGILTTTKINQLGSAAETPWTNIYIQDSYKRGVQRATYEMGKEGIQLPNDIPAGLQASINTPFHIDRVGLLYTRAFSDLKGITKAMDIQISRILAQGLVDGDNPRTLAKKINDQVDGIGKARARTLARTEIIRAHHAGMIGEYRNYGIAGVKVKAEWVTAGFNVCPKCQSNEGKIYTLDEIEGMIPFHPNCRCMALPTMPEKGVNKGENVQEKGYDYANVRESENTYKMMGTEVANVFDNTGKWVGSSVGTSTQCPVPEIAKTQKVVFTHNHPKGTKYELGNMLRIGSSFSSSDIQVASTFNMIEMRATTPEFVFSMKPGKKGWPTSETIKETYEKYDQKVLKDFSNRIDEGITTINKATVMHWHLVNRLAAKELGMIYTKIRIR